MYPGSLLEKGGLASILESKDKKAKAVAHSWIFFSPFSSHSRDLIPHQLVFCLSLSDLSSMLELLCLPSHTQVTGAAISCSAGPRPLLTAPCSRVQDSPCLPLWDLLGPAQHDSPLSVQSAPNCGVLCRFEHACSGSLTLSQTLHLFNLLNLGLSLSPLD